MALLAIVTPDEWVSRTKLLLSRRSPALRTADEAYANYYRSRSLADMDALHEALKAYLREHGGYWDKVERDQKSGGLMRYIYEKTAPVVPSDRAAIALQNRIPETRHGVLHLWRNANVETSWGMIMLEGGLSLGTADLGFADASHLIPGNLHNLAVAGGVAGTAAGVGVGYVRGQETADAIAPRSHPQHAAGPVQINELGRQPDRWEAVSSFLGHAFHAAYEAVKDFVMSIINKVRMNQGMAIGLASTAVEKLVMFILAKSCAAAAPFVGGAINLGRGIFAVVSGVKDRLSAYFARGKFCLSPGHPTLIADAIETQMNWAIGKGLYNTIKGGAKLAGNFFTAGASAIVDLIAAALEFATRFIMRFFEGRAIRSWIDEVAGTCAGGWVNDAKNGDVRRPAIAFDDSQFNALFERGCNASVCVPMMTLNSGICGDQMMFMRMFDDLGGVVTQKTFDAATGYLRKLKETGRNYLRSTGFIFSSSSRDVQGYMAHAVHHHTPGGLSLGAAALKFVS
jgi:hypothetical protein